MPEQIERRRRRPAVSCSLCRRRKIRCNRETPCSNCIRSKNENCTYENHPTPHPQPRHRHESIVGIHIFEESEDGFHKVPVGDTPSSSQTSTIQSPPSEYQVTASTSPSSLASHHASQDVDAMKDRIKMLEAQLAKLNSKTSSPPAPTPPSHIETMESTLGGVIHSHHDSRLFGQAQLVSRSVMHKRRLFGQSNWMNSVAGFRDICEAIEPHIQQEDSKAAAGIRRCKAMSKFWKSLTFPTWPTSPTPDLPSKDVADELVSCYLRTSEPFYRVLHIPTFQRAYDAIWSMGTEPDMGFLIQLKLVLAIGAVTYDEEFSLRTSAIRWIYEAQTYLSEPKFKARLRLDGLQTDILLLIARGIVGVDEGLIWISAGALLRSAMFMGLHRDPARLPKRTVFAFEMRRRIWNTILELTLQTSLTSGGPPLISLHDFDTEPPRNLDDDQLLEDDPTPKPDSEFTQVSIVRALQQMFPIRLAIAKFLNDHGAQGTYEETLRLDSNFRSAYKALRESLKSHSSASERPISQLELRVVDFIMHRYLLSIHIPFFRPALHDTQCAFSRKVVTETSLKIWCAAFPSSTTRVAQPATHQSLPARDDLERLVMCGSGFFRTVTFQATLAIAAELKTELQEDDGLESVPLRPDLLAVVSEARAWALRCIEIGETNIKGYLLICLFSAQIEGLIQDCKKEDFARLLVKAAEEVVDKCLPIYEGKVTQCQAETNQEGQDQISFDMVPESAGDWDFLMTDALFDFGADEPMHWMMNDNLMSSIT